MSSKKNKGRRHRDAIGGSRQLLYPADLRVSPTRDWFACPDALQTPIPQPPPTVSHNNEKELTAAVRALATVATALWRIRVKLPVDDKGELPATLRHVPRHVQAAWDALMKAGLRIEDPTGKKYVPGMAVSVAAFQPKPGINTEMIEETLKPAIFYRDTLVQQADVIVATPESDVSASPTLATNTGDNTN